MDKLYLQGEVSTVNSVFTLVSESNLLGLPLLLDSLAIPSVCGAYLASQHGVLGQDMDLYGGQLIHLEIQVAHFALLTFISRYVDGTLHLRLVTHALPILGQGSVGPLGLHALLLPLVHDLLGGDESHESESFHHDLVLHLVMPYYDGVLYFTTYLEGHTTK